MIRQEFARIDPKRRNNVDHRKKQFATPTYQSLEYKHRLNFYVVPPTADITLEQFEQWAIDRLRGIPSYSPTQNKSTNTLQSSQNSKPVPFAIARPLRQLHT
jgi:DNA primase large subunit